MLIKTINVITELCDDKIFVPAQKMYYGNA